MPASTAHDVVVIGARVAGAATAMLLARAGLRVLVIDQSRPGSDTFSTHALMRGGVIQLSRWGLLDQVRAAGTPAVRQTIVRYGDTEEIVEIDPIDHCDALYAPRRTLLDPLMVEAARRAGAEVRFGLRVVDLLRDVTGRVAGVVARDRAGRTHELRARTIVGADGLRSFVARRVGAFTYGRGSHASALIAGWFDDVEVDGYRWLYAPGAGAGIIPTNGGQVCAWVGMPAARFADLSPAPLEQVFHAHVRGVAPDWAARLESAPRREPLRGFPGVPGFLRQPWGRGWSLVGDAAHFKDPLSAHGMTDALRDAELLADAIVETLVLGRSEVEAFGAYQALRDELSRDVHEVSERVAAYDWSMDRLRDLLIRMSHGMRAEVAHLLERARQPMAA